ncbi:MAG: flavin monoamine oxidase family protein [Thermomicrobiales bacterium]|nr:flavin monoamine oxidase family protein [Thermomicrobiales bacterium]
MMDKTAKSLTKGSPMTRRRFLHLTGAALGSAGVLNVLNAWGQNAMDGLTEPPKWDGNGNGTKVIVIGTGAGGCPAAYELINLGYDVTIIEARDRVGGHVWTIRGGSSGEEYGKGVQTCDWPEGFWWDAGPSRVPFYHNGFFHYCRELNVPLIDHKNLNLNGWVYAENVDGELNATKIRLHEMQADMGGYTSQYLAQALDQNALDEPLSEEDLEHWKSYLINWGILNATDLTYRKSDHRGFAVLPDVHSPGTINDPYPLRDLLPFADSIMQAAGGYLAATATFDWQTTMVKPKGGMDALYDVAFREFFGDRLHLNSPVTKINQTPNDVTVTYTDGETGETVEITGDYVMCNIPLSALLKVSVNFDEPMKTAIRSVPYAMALRMGIGFKRRFWEEDDWIYGGQSFTNISQLGILGYPDDNYLSEGGVMLGMYNFGTNAAYVSSMPYDARAQLALSLGSKVHPQMKDEFISAFSVAWHLEPYSLGAWPSFTAESREQVMPILQEPDGRIYLVGEHLSNVNAWMEGAVQAAWMQVDKLHTRVMQS